MILGITGGVGAGKSSVLAILEKEYNAKLILADEVGRELMQPGEAIMSISLMHLEKKF